MEQAVPNKKFNNNRTRAHELPEGHKTQIDPRHRLSNKKAGSVIETPSEEENENEMMIFNDEKDHENETELEETNYDT